MSELLSPLILIELNFLEDFLVIDFASAKVDELGVEVRIKDDIARLEISVYDLHLAKVAQGND